MGWFYLFLAKTLVAFAVNEVFVGFENEGMSFLGRMRSLSLFEGEGFVAFEENEELCRFLKKAPQKL